MIWSELVDAFAVKIVPFKAIKKMLENRSGFSRNFTADDCVFYPIYIV
jgi:hypothetical protein